MRAGWWDSCEGGWEGLFPGDGFAKDDVAIILMPNTKLFSLGKKCEKIRYTSGCSLYNPFSFNYVHNALSIAAADPRD